MKTKAVCVSFLSRCIVFLWRSHLSCTRKLISVVVVVCGYVMVDWKSFITTWSFFYYYVAIFFVACPPPPCVHASNKSLSALLSKQRMKSTTQNNAQPSTSAAAAQGTVTPSSSAQPVQQQHQQQRDMPRLYSSLIAGVGSGALASVICAPLDLIRTRLQVWTEVKHGSPTVAIPQMLRDIVKREGVTGCFRGLGATLLTVPLFWGVYFPLYDDFKRTWSLQFPTTDTTFIHMGAAVSAGVISDIICNPMFVVRTRLQTEALHQIMSSSPGTTAARGGGGLPTKMSMLQTAKSLYKEGGPFIFWRGMTANLMGLSHVGVQFPVYEKLKLFFRQHKKHESPFDLLLASGLSKMTASLLTYPHEVSIYDYQFLVDVLLLLLYVQKKLVFHGFAFSLYALFISNYIQFTHPFPQFTCGNTIQQ